MAPRRKPNMGVKPCCTSYPPRPSSSTSLTMYLCLLPTPARSRLPPHQHFSYLMVHWETLVVMQYQLRQADIYEGDWPECYWPLWSISSWDNPDEWHTQAERMMKRVGSAPGGDPYLKGAGDDGGCGCYSWVRRVAEAFLGKSLLGQREIQEMDRWCDYPLRGGPAIKVEHMIKPDPYIKPEAFVKPEPKEEPYDWGLSAIKQDPYPKFKRDPDARPSTSRRRQPAPPPPPVMQYQPVPRGGPPVWPWATTGAIGHPWGTRETDGFGKWHLCSDEVWAQWQEEIKAKKMQEQARIKEELEATQMRIKEEDQDHHWWRG